VSVSTVLSFHVNYLDIYFCLLVLQVMEPKKIKDTCLAIIEACARERVQYLTCFDRAGNFHWRAFRSRTSRSRLSGYVLFLVLLFFSGIVKSMSDVLLNEVAAEGKGSCGLELRFLDDSAGKTDMNSVAERQVMIIVQDYCRFRYRDGIST
jgi:hypothetical protein